MRAEEHPPGASCPVASNTDHLVSADAVESDPEAACPRTRVERDPVLNEFAAHDAARHRRRVIDNAVNQRRRRR